MRYHRETCEMLSTEINISRPSFRKNTKLVLVSPININFGEVLMGVFSFTDELQMNSVFPDCERDFHDCAVRQRGLWVRFVLFLTAGSGHRH